MRRTPEEDRQYRKDNKEKMQVIKKKYYDKHIEDIRVARRKRRQEWLAFIKADKVFCEVCGYREHFAALQFHHRDSSTKKWEISALMARSPNRKNKKLMRQELRKCDVLCSNCHDVLHYKLKGGTE